MSYTSYKQKYPQLLCPHCRKRTSYKIHDRKAEENIKGIRFAWKEVFGFCKRQWKRRDINVEKKSFCQKSMIRIWRSLRKNFGNIIMKKRSVKIKRRISYERAFIFKSR